MRATAFALLLLTSTSHAEPAWVFSGGVGRSWPEFVPTGYRTLDAGIGGFAAVSVPVYTLPDQPISVELGGRVAAAYMSGQQFAGSISNEYQYLSFGGLAQAGLVFRERAWFALAAGLHHARIKDAASSNETTTHGDDSYTLAAEVGVDLYSGLGLYVNTSYLGDGGMTIGVGVAFRLVTGP